MIIVTDPEEEKQEQQEESGQGLLLLPNAGQRVGSKLPKLAHLPKRINRPVRPQVTFRTFQSDCRCMSYDFLTQGVSRLDECSVIYSRQELVGSSIEIPRFDITSTSISDGVG